MRLIQAAEVGLGTALHLSAAIERGEWIVIMGDRVSVKHEERTIDVNFPGRAGASAAGAVPAGDFVALPLSICCSASRRTVASACIFSVLSESAATPPRSPQRAPQEMAQRYAGALEDIVRAAPYQWFNFYDYWARPLAGTGR
ncbi:MAG: hypothetical protein WDM79_03265 [Terricaulis sp.]